MVKVLQFLMIQMEHLQVLETLDQVEVEVDIKHHLIFQVVVEMVVLVLLSLPILFDKYLKT